MEWEIEKKESPGNILGSCKKIYKTRIIFL